MKKKHIICKRCIMDTTDPYIFFDQAGNCNHCNAQIKKLNALKQNQQKENGFLEKKISEIKKQGEGKEFDCLIGISGGVDSSYIAYLAKEEFGLSPLAVHLDNGWNSKLAVKNIRNIINKLGIDLHTHVIDWEEFKGLQKAYFKASVLDIEALTDHAIKATLYHTAKKHNITTIITGFNPYTEGLFPKAWSFNKKDDVNIRDIVAKNSNTTIKTYPIISQSKLDNDNSISHFPIFSYYHFDSEVGKEIIIDKLKWTDYGGKHHESVFTRFYQGYYLPSKFNIDKRKAHLSALICNGSITRKEAVEELQSLPYDQNKMEEDLEYLIKKLDYGSKSEFEKIVKAPPVSHFEYKTNLYSKIQKKLMLPTNPVAQIVNYFK